MPGTWHSCIRMLVPHLAPGLAPPCANERGKHFEQKPKTHHKDPENGSLSLRRPCAKLAPSLRHDMCTCAHVHMCTCVHVSMYTYTHVHMCRHGQCDTLRHILRLGLRHLAPSERGACKLDDNQYPQQNRRQGGFFKCPHVKRKRH